MVSYALTRGYRSTNAPKCGVGRLPLGSSHAVTGGGPTESFLAELGRRARAVLLRRAACLIARHAAAWQAPQALSPLSEHACD